MTDDRLKKLLKEKENLELELKNEKSIPKPMTTCYLSDRLRSDRQEETLEGFVESENEKWIDIAQKLERVNEEISKLK